MAHHMCHQLRVGHVEIPPSVPAQRLSHLELRFSRALLEAARRRHHAAQMGNRETIFVSRILLHDAAMLVVDAPRSRYRTR